MTAKKASYDELEYRLNQAEAVMESLRSGQVDAVVGSDSVALLRLAEAEKKLRRNQERLQVALAASGGGVFEHSVPLDGSCFHDERWAEIVGYRLDELPPYGEAFKEWFNEQIHPEDRGGGRIAIIVISLWGKTSVMTLSCGSSISKGTGYGCAVLHRRPSVTSGGM